MSIKQEDISLFLESECQGFIFDTARSFLTKHSDPKVLFNQLHSLYSQGKNQACKDLIQLIFEERHPLSDNSLVILLRARIAFEENETIKEAKDWVKQALIANQHCEKTALFSRLLEARTQLRDGLYDEGQETLFKLLDSDFEAEAAFVLGQHFLWKSHSTDQSINLLEMAVNSKPHFVKAWATLGFAFNKVGLKEKAQSSFAQCLEHEKNPLKVAFYKQQFAS